MIGTTRGDRLFFVLVGSLLLPDLPCVPLRVFGAMADLMKDDNQLIRSTEVHNAESYDLRLSVCSTAAGCRRPALHVFCSHCARIQTTCEWSAKAHTTSVVDDVTHQNNAVATVSWAIVAP